MKAVKWVYDDDPRAESPAIPLAKWIPPPDTVIVTTTETVVPTLGGP